MPKESQYIKGWENVGDERGSLRTKRADLLELASTLENPVPESIRMAVEGTNDLNKLAQWFSAALKVDTIADLRRAMQLEP